MSEDAQHGGVMNRIENTRAESLVRYWRAAAYDSHNERDAAEWAKIALVPLFTALVLGLSSAAVYYVLDLYPQYFPAEGTLLWQALDFIPLVFEGLFTVLLAMSVMYLLKLLLLVWEMEFEEVTA